MNVEYHKYWSSNLNRDMEFMVYGHWGKPILVFPSKGGSFNEYQDFGMVDVLQPLIDAGKIQLFCVDSVDKESWCNEEVSCGDRAWRHCQYDKYITDEAVPFIRARTGHEKLIAHGNSYGAYHSSNIFFRHPDLFDTVIAVSGPFHPRYCVGDYMDDNVYFNAPLAYLPGNNDPWYIDQYRNSTIVVCVGQGYWEDKFLADTQELKAILEQKQIPAWIDIWGHDVSHDWPWWRQMVPHVLATLGY